jgi:hypothetical protein
MKIFLAEYLQQEIFFLPLQSQSQTAETKSESESLIGTVL